MKPWILLQGSKIRVLINWPWKLFANTWAPTKMVKPSDQNGKFICSNWALLLHRCYWSVTSETLMRMICFKYFCLVSMSSFWIFVSVIGFSVVPSYRFWVAFSNAREITPEIYLWLLFYESLWFFLSMDKAYAYNMLGFNRSKL